MREAGRGEVCSAVSSGGGTRALLFGVVLLLGGCRQEHVVPAAGPPRCEAITEIVGKYECGGECIVPGKDGAREVVKVSGEVDTVERYPGTESELYQVNITGSGGFSELEIGALVGDTLRTATAQVSDEKYPVLEEYIFDADSACKARGFFKVVHNPSKADFKSCLIRCQKSE
jgi:hypothetical protein